MSLPFSFTTCIHVSSYLCTVDTLFSEYFCFPFHHSTSTSVLPCQYHSTSTSVFPCRYHSTSLSVFPCQYYSTSTSVFLLFSPVSIIPPVLLFSPVSIIPPVLLFSPVSIIPPVLCIHLHRHVFLTSRTNGRCLGTFQKAKLFRKSGCNT